MCRYCKGTGKYRLLDRLVDCDQCDAVKAGEPDEYGILTGPSIFAILPTISAAPCQDLRLLHWPTSSQPLDNEFPF